MSVAVGPAETDAPLVVDAKTLLPRAITTQLLEPIARRYPEVVKPNRGVDVRQFAQHHAVQIGRKVPDRLAIPESRRGAISETSDHGV